MNYFNYLLLITCLIFSTPLYAQNDTTLAEETENDSLNSNNTTDSLDNLNRLNNDSINSAAIKEYNRKLTEIEGLRIADSIKKAELEIQLSKLKTTDNLEKDELLKQLKAIEQNELDRVSSKKSKIDSLRNIAKGYPVIGTIHDTLFYIYAKIGASTSKDRAKNITDKIEILYDDDFFDGDSLIIEKLDVTADIVYGEMIIMSVSENDAIWYGGSIDETAVQFKNLILSSIETGKEEYSFFRIFLRIFWILLVLFIVRVLIWLIGIGYNKLLNYFTLTPQTWLKALQYKDYVFLSTEKELQIIFLLIKALKWFSYGLIGYISLPIIFSIFPFTRTWANTLFGFIWSPVLKSFDAVYGFIPNLFTILVIYFIMRYLIKFVHYIFNEIQADKLTISGFHSDWAIPTYHIVKFLLYAFMFILIFPYLPGSDSAVFQGVSVFIGVLFSLGSSTAISNMIAGLVITYMRPFKIGDRIKIGDVTGDVIEKTMLVTRLRTAKNEIITIPNSSVLSGNTINYSSDSKEQGLIIHTTITIGYDIPWKDMHQTLIDAALRTNLIEKEPLPFVLQTSLEDFYVAYQINAYTKAANKQATIYSDLHQNIQDVCNENGIEILSPHYRAARDGNNTTIPLDYLKPDYQPPSFNINIKNENDRDSNTIDKKDFKA